MFTIKSKEKFPKWFLVIFLASTLLLSGGYVKADAASTVTSSSTGAIATVKYDNINFRSAQVIKASNIIGHIPKGTVLPVTAANNTWVLVVYNGVTGYVWRNYAPVTEHAVPTTAEYQAAAQATAAQAQAAAAQAQAQAQSTLTAQQQKLVDVAKTQLGVPYAHTMKPGIAFDCSNFTAWIYRDALGIYFSSSSRSQRYSASIGKQVILDPSDKYKNLQVGDLLFFKNSADPGDGSLNQSTSGGGGHVGMYAGEINGKHYIVQEGGGRAKVTYEPMEHTWFASSLVYAKRIL